MSPLFWWSNDIYYRQAALRHNVPSFKKMNVQDSKPVMIWERAMLYCCVIALLLIIIVPNSTLLYNE